jgi:hypothetical protein
MPQDPRRHNSQPLAPRRHNHARHHTVDSPTSSSTKRRRHLCEVADSSLCSALSPATSGTVDAERRSARLLAPGCQSRCVEAIHGSEQSNDRMGVSKNGDQIRPTMLRTRTRWSRQISDPPEQPPESATTLCAAIPSAPRARVMVVLGPAGCQGLRPVGSSRLSPRSDRVVLQVAPWCFRRGRTRTRGASV